MGPNALVLIYTIMNPVYGGYMRYICARIGCNNVIEVPDGTVRFYCSRLCRYLARGSKRGVRLARKFLKKQSIIEK